IYIKPRYHVDITINRFGKAFVDERQMGAGYDEEDYDVNNDNGYDQAMNARAFEQFKQTIRTESFDNAKLIMAKQTISRNYFNASQVREIVELFSFENSKLDIA